MKTTPKYIIYREWIILGSAVVLSLFLILFNESSFNDTLRSYGLDAYSLLHFDYFSLREKNEMEKEIADLKTKLISLESSIEVNESSIEENYRLRKLLSIQIPDSFGFVYARIAGRNPGSSNTSLLINAGTEKGVAPGNAVITDAGVVGMIESSGEKISHVALISGKPGKIAVRTEISRAFGIMTPLDQKTARIDEIAKSVPVNIGEKIYTADISELFPPNLLIGTVISASDSSATINKKIIISFSQDLDLIEDVFVLGRLDNK
jgi:rod shape-determining protein MreC